MGCNRNICIVGLGYVGLPVAMCFAKNSHVIGFDIDGARVDDLRQGRDSNHEHTRQELEGLDINYTSDPADISVADCYIITVPTPIDENKQPDLSLLASASVTVGHHLNKNDIVVYESTVYPGATEEYCIPILAEASGLTAGRDFFVAYSPERINPGDKKHVFNNIQKIVSAQTDDICQLVAEIYGSVIDAQIYKAPSIKVAEAAKIIENTQRDLNIALMNEFSLIFNKMQIDTLDVLRVAGTKWNFLPFKPGLVGGHCIGVDPYYLTYKASLLGYTPKIILAGRDINDNMGQVIANRLIKAMRENNLNIQDSMVTILGLTFKEEVSDLRNSKVLDITNELQRHGVNLQLHDPVADNTAVRSLFNLDLAPLDQLKPANAIVLAVAHQMYSNMNWSDIVPLIDTSTEKAVVFDIKGILPRHCLPQDTTLLRL